MPRDEMEWARSGERGVDHPEDAQSRTTGRLPRLPSALTVGRPVASVAPAPRQEVRGGGAWDLLEKAAGFVSTKKDGEAADVRDEDGDTGALSQETDVLGYGATAGKEPDCCADDGEEEEDEGFSSDRSGSCVTKDGETTSNFPSTAMLQHN